MREVIIAITCDACRQQFTEPVEGANAVSLTVGLGDLEKQWKMDVCDECLGGPFFEHARPVEAKKSKPFVCDCGKSYTSQRGLSKHKSGAHGSD